MTHAGKSESREAPPRCGDVKPGNYGSSANYIPVCLLIPGHDGDHAALVGRSQTLTTWPNYFPLTFPQLVDEWIKRLDDVLPQSTYVVDKAPDAETRDVLVDCQQRVHDLIADLRVVIRDGR
jgi:hypothetical protein